MLRTITVLTLLSFTLAAGGCLVTSKKRVDESGTRVSPATLNQIELGETTEGWVRATLGPATAVSSVPDNENMKLLRYTYTKEKSSSGSIFLIFGGSSRERETTTTYFEVTDGVVTRHWTES